MRCLAWHRKGYCMNYLKTFMWAAAGTLHTFDEGTVDQQLLQDTDTAAMLQIAAAAVFILAAAAVSLILAFYAIRRRTDSKNGIVIFRSGGRRALHNTSMLMYKTLDNFALTHRFISKLRRQFEMIMPGDARFAKLKALQTACAVWGVSAAAVIVVVVAKPSVYLLMCTSIILHVVSSEIVSGLVMQNEVKLLKELKKFIDRVRHYYLVENMIDEAVYDAIGDAGPMMQAHGKLVLDVLQKESDKVTDALLEYKSAVSNRFLKQFMAVCLTTLANGDKKINKQSLCVTNLKNLSVDIDIELRKKYYLKMAFAGLTALTVAPVCFLLPIRSWSVSNVPATQYFYYGQAGALVIILCFAVTLVCYTLVSRYKEAYQAETHAHFVLRELYDWKPVKRFVDNYWNRNYGRKLKTDTVLKQTGSKIRAEHFFLQQILLMVLLYAGVVAVVLFANYQTRKVTMESYTSVADASVSGTEAQYLIMMVLSKYYFDEYRGDGRTILEMYNDYAASEGIEAASQYSGAVKNWFYSVMGERYLEGGVSLSDEEVVGLIHQYNRLYSSTTKLATKIFGTLDFFARDSEEKSVAQAYKQIDDIMEKARREDPLANTEGMYDIVTKTVYDKMSMYSSAYFKWYYLVFALLGAAAGFMAPVWLLHFNMQDLQTRMEDEVIQFQAVILLLIYHDDVNVMTILEWLDMFAEIFSDSIGRCITSIEMDEDAALDRLSEDEPFEMFNQIVENLKMADRVGVMQAFNDLEAARLSCQENRALQNDMIMPKKRAAAALAAAVPMGCVIWGYFVIPFIYNAMTQLGKLMEQIQEMG